MQNIDKTVIKEFLELHGFKNSEEIIQKILLMQHNNGVSTNDIKINPYLLSDIFDFSTIDTAVLSNNLMQRDSLHRTNALLLNFINESISE